MDLLERYLAEVRRNLPAHDADDIVAELRDVLMARAEDQEETTGKADWDSLLREFGHPLVVAARYRRQQWLIGPELYPFYLHGLKIIVGIVLAVVTAIAIVRGMLWDHDVGQAIASYLGSLWWSAAASVGSVTIVFALVERFAGSSAKLLSRWKPRELPEVESRQPSIYESVLEIGGGVLFLLWWLGIVPTPQFGHEGFRLIAAPVWHQLFWPVAALLVSQLVFNVVRRLRPRWTAVRVTLGVVNAVSVLGIILFAYRSGRWLTVVSTGISPDQVNALQASLDLAFRIGAVVGVVAFVLNMAAEMWRTMRRRGPFMSMPAA
jgi:hypothetical protein